MDARFSDVKVMIWDFDGTFYHATPEIHAAIRESEYRVIMDHTHWSHEKAVEEFHKVFPAVTPSGTKAVSIITGISVAFAAAQTGTDLSLFIKKDEKLPILFDTLKSYRHFMLVNGTQHSVQKGLALLGVERSLFEDVVTSEVVGDNKPSEKGFQYILAKTGLPARHHIMIGDREMVDLAPAKKVGMHTCLVWSDTASSIADVTVPTVYDVAPFFV